MCIVTFLLCLCKLGFNPANAGIIIGMTPLVRAIIKGVLCYVILFSLYTLLRLSSARLYFIHGGLPILINTHSCSLHSVV
jgi:hypothetical protein